MSIPRRQHRSLQVSTTLEIKAAILDAERQAQAHVYISTQVSCRPRLYHAVPAWLAEADTTADYTLRHSSTHDTPATAPLTIRAQAADVRRKDRRRACQHHWSHPRPAR